MSPWPMALVNIVFLSSLMVKALPRAEPLVLSNSEEETVQFRKSYRLQTINLRDPEHREQRIAIRGNSTLARANTSGVLCTPPDPANGTGGVTPGMILRRARVTGSTEALYPVLQHVVPVRIEQQLLYVVSDTGSADTWVLTKKSKVDDLPCHRLYDPHDGGGRDDDAELTEKTFAIVYNTFAASGPVYKDDVHLAGFVIRHLEIGAADILQPATMMTPLMDGIMGLAGAQGSNCRPTKCNTVSSRLKRFLRKPLFTVNFPYLGPGNLDFGFIDRNQYEGRINYARTRIDLSRDIPGGWVMVFYGFSIGWASRARPAHYQDYRCLIDTGTTVLIFQDELLTAYFSHFPAIFRSTESPRLFGVYCQDLMLLKDIHLLYQTSDSRPERLIIRRWHIQREDEDDDVCWTQLFSSRDFDDDRCILGVPFFNSHFVVFDMAPQPRIGFAKVNPYTA